MTKVANSIIQEMLSTEQTYCGKLKQLVGNIEQLPDFERDSFLPLLEPIKMCIRFSEGLQEGGEISVAFNLDEPPIPEIIQRRERLIALFYQQYIEFNKVYMPLSAAGQIPAALNADLMEIPQRGPRYRLLLKQLLDQRETLHPDKQVHIQNLYRLATEGMNEFTLVSNNLQVKTVQNLIDDISSLWTSIKQGNPRFTIAGALNKYSETFQLMRPKEIFNEDIIEADFALLPNNALIPLSWANRNEELEKAIRFFNLIYNYKNLNTEEIPTLKTDQQNTIEEKANHVLRQLKNAVSSCTSTQDKVSGEITHTPPREIKHASFMLQCLLYVSTPTKITSRVFLGAGLLTLGLVIALAVVAPHTALPALLQGLSSPSHLKLIMVTAAAVVLTSGLLLVREKKARTYADGVQLANRLFNKKEPKDSQDDPDSAPSKARMAERAENTFPY